MNLAEFTSPCSVVFNNKLYLFFSSSGNNGIFCTSSTDGSNWSQVVSIMSLMGSEETYAPRTSASAVVHKGLLYLFWNSNANDGLRYSTFGTSWGAPKNVSAANLHIRAQTSSAVVEFNERIYLFFNGAGQNGTFKTTFADGSWLGVVPLGPAVSGMGFLDATSPAAFTSYDGRELTLTWSGVANDGIWYSSTTDGTIWNVQQPIIDKNQVLYKSGTCGVSYTTQFHTSSGGDFTEPQQALLSGKEFTLIVTGFDTVTFFQSRFGPRTRIFAGEDNYLGVITEILGNEPKKANEVVTGLLSLSLLAVLKRRNVTVEMNPFRWYFGS
ncbi:hypothetical protein AOQ84DRAFT_372443 [Glonium stellatum]|uniref:Uncharacterized protein n=1 Tax=Glonium stellatum TaxID=574774 RepID=A0A8E2JXH4_9PEZI|nr:hypothetical protein AOQ84DRAFT_372443 [Glonium stellatum]